MLLEHHAPKKKQNNGPIASCMLLGHIFETACYWSTMHQRKSKTMGSLLPAATQTMKAQQ
jgi:hypothetical protein